MAALVACSEEEDLAKSGSSLDNQAINLATVTLNAFSDFSCSRGWSNRDGALGLTAGAGSGTCEATFPGVSGRYRITLQAQTEFDGEPPYRIMINGRVVHQGSYPLSSSLGCDCPLDNWREVCPDRVIDLDAGVHAVNSGDVIGFYGQETYPCGSHGAYAKWRAIVLTPSG